MYLIEEFIPRGHENAIHRATLRDILHMGDREIRRSIEEANMSGRAVILNLGEGYFRFDKRTDQHYLDFYIAMEQSRVRNINRKLRKMREAADA